MRHFVTIFILFFLVEAFCVVQFPRPQGYDIIIVGAGGGGSVMANRIAKLRTDLSILLIDEGRPESPEQISLGASSTPTSQWQVNSLPVEQNFLALTRAPSLVRYKAVGGTTKIFGCVYARASKELLDSTYPNGFKYDDLLPYYKANEDHFCHYLSPTLTNITASDCLQYHGKNGENQIAPQVFDLVSAPMNNLISYLGSQGEYSPNYNNPNTRVGISYEQAYRKMSNQSDILSARSRVDAQLAFLPSSTLNQLPNLDILPFTQVTKLEFKQGNTINGVSYIINGTIDGFVKARIRVILSAGVIKTPQLLMLSGVGPSSVLQPLGIALVANNTAVGADLSSHHALIMGYRSKIPLVHNSTYSFYNAAQWFFNTGLTPSVPADIQVEMLDGFYVTSVEGSADGLPVPIVQSLLGGGDINKLPFIGPEVTNIATTIRGSVKLVSTNPHIEPFVDLGWNFANFFTTPDLTKMLVAISRVREIFRGNNSFANNNIEEEIWPGNFYRDFVIASGVTTEPALTTQADILFIQYALTHFYHLTGTCSLGKCTDLNGAVNGVIGLSVCDNSLLPENPDANPTATLQAVCRKLADQIAATA